MSTRTAKPKATAKQRSTTRPRNTEAKAARPREATASADEATSEQGATATTRPEFASLERLSEHLGASTLDDVLVHAEGMTRDELIEWGAEVATPRIDEDALDLCAAATAFFETAHEEARNVVMLDREFVRVAAWGAWQGQQAYRQLTRGAAQAKTTRGAQAQKREATLARVRPERDRLAAALQSVAAQNAELRARITTAARPQASGLAETGAHVALESLVAIGRELLESSDSGVAKRRASFKLTKARLDAWAKLAAEAKAAMEDADAPATGAEVTQATVDFWDGLNLALLDTLIRQFAVARAIDKRVPRLQPRQLLTALRPSQQRRKASARKGGDDQDKAKGGEPKGGGG